MAATSFPKEDQNPAARKHPPERARKHSPADASVETVTGALKRPSSSARRTMSTSSASAARRRSRRRCSRRRAACSRSAASASGRTRSSWIGEPRGVPVFNAPFSNTRSVAELIVAEIMVLSRQLGDRSSEVHAGKWKKVAIGCHEVRGKTLGIVGYGHIGIADRRARRGDRHARHLLRHRHQAADGQQPPVPTLDALLAQADFVTLHVPETPQTKNMIGAAELAQMRRALPAQREPRHGRGYRGARGRDRERPRRRRRGRCVSRASRRRNSEGFRRRCAACRT